jgi:hypothetical protein
MDHLATIQEIEYDIGLKVTNKLANKNQTGTGRPVIVLVNVSSVDGSHGPVINGTYSYPVTKIPPGIDGVVAYWLTLDSIKPWQSSVSLNTGHNPIVRLLQGVFTKQI